jgi:hypothetical protein
MVISYSFRVKIKRLILKSYPWMAKSKLRRGRPCYGSLIRSSQSAGQWAQSQASYTASGSINLMIVWISIDNGQCSACGPWEGPGQSPGSHAHPQRGGGWGPKSFELRMSFVPYLYAAFNEYHLHGTPPLRALMMNWPTDPATAHVDDEFMFDPSILVAPLLNGQAQRSIPTRRQVARLLDE